MLQNWFKKESSLGFKVEIKSLSKLVLEGVYIYFLSLIKSWSFLGPPFPLQHVSEPKVGIKSSSGSH